MQSFVLIFQIFLAISLGYFVAPQLSQQIKQFVFKILPYFSYLLLISVAFELTQALNHISNPIAILPPALLIAFTTSIGSFFICLITYTLIDRQSVQGKISLHLFMNALKNIAKAFFALGIGILLGILINTSNIQIVFNSWYLLLVFIFLIGVELAFTQFDRSWLSWKILLVPFAAFVGSCLASILNYYLLPKAFKLNEVLASLEEMEHDGLLQINGQTLKVTEAGKPYVRNICMAFDLLLKRKAPATKLFSMTI